LEEGKLTIRRMKEDRMKEESSKCREAFEAWCKLPGEWESLKSAQWLAWQAAWTGSEGQPTHKVEVSLSSSRSAYDKWWADIGKFLNQPAWNAWRCGAQWALGGHLNGLPKRAETMTAGGEPVWDTLKRVVEEMNRAYWALEDARRMNQP